MEETRKKRLKGIEDRVDADYANLFSKLGSWEAGAVNLLMAHECAMLGSDPQLTADRYKYPLMHALRFGKNSPSSPDWSVPTQLGAATLSNARACLEKAREYVGIWGAFWRGFNDVVSVDIRDDKNIVFGSNPEWTAFDVLDHMLGEEYSDHNTVRGFGYIIEQAARESKMRSLGNVIASRMYSPNFEVLKRAIPHLKVMDQTDELLPTCWIFRQLKIQDFRKFWIALRAIAFLHSRIVNDAMPPTSSPTSRLLVCSRTDLVKWICRIVDIDPTSAEAILKYHVYDRKGNTPDIALTQFIPIGRDLLIAAPSLIWSSQFERNLCAHLARTCNDEFATSTDPCAENMARKLSDHFQNQGFLVGKTDFKISNSDLDLLVYSPSECFVLHAELRWLVPPADVAEVFKRGEKECLKKLNSQLPKHLEVLSTDAEGLLNRAFGPKHIRGVNGFGNMLITEGFVGTPRMRIDPYAFCDSRIILKRLASENSLSNLFNWCRKMPYLPVNGADFQIIEKDVTTSSGIHITHHETCRRKQSCDNDAFSAL